MWGGCGGRVDGSDGVTGEGGVNSCTVHEEQWKPPPIRPPSSPSPKSSPSPLLASSSSLAELGGLRGGSIAASSSSSGYLIRSLIGFEMGNRTNKQSAHFYSVEITEREAQMGVVCRVCSADKSKFKLLYFEQEENGLSLALQVAITKDPDAKFFKKLDGFQACEVNELRAGTHTFAVYGDNFFKSVSYTIEVMCAEQFSAEKEKLQDVEAKILTKRAELSKFETEYREIDELLKERNAIHASYTSINPLKLNSSSSKLSSAFNGSNGEEECPTKEKKSKDEKKCQDQTKRKKWFKIHLKMDKRKPC
ncbi:hypothetical protein B296_00049954 [Ensete ventricosum]|uniref:Uncharacterized protein n=1 Tax=Ensete ventricosum TaxID=4639 RepID=A0A426YNJ5_ENSVE|nr:hypothetical protein B296_00049954 [Ensete ventricosum]